MPTAQDFYNSLIKNPDYQGTSGMSREELVEKEAIRRARQHHNNELALSMAAPISAMEKLALYLTKARWPESYDDTDDGGKLSDYIQNVYETLNEGYQLQEGSIHTPLKVDELYYRDPTGFMWTNGESAGTGNTGWHRFHDALASYVQEYKGVLEGGDEGGFRMPTALAGEIEGSRGRGRAAEITSNRMTAWASSIGDYLEDLIKKTKEARTAEKGSALDDDESKDAEAFAADKVYSHLAAMTAHEHLNRIIPIVEKRNAVELDPGEDQDRPTDEFTEKIQELGKADSSPTDPGSFPNSVLGSHSGNDPSIKNYFYGEEGGEQRGKFEEMSNRQEQAGDFDVGRGAGAAQLGPTAEEGPVGWQGLQKIDPHTWMALKNQTKQKAMRGIIAQSGYEGGIAGSNRNDLPDNLKEELEALNVITMRVNGLFTDLNQRAEASNGKESFWKQEERDLVFGPDSVFEPISYGPQPGGSRGPLGGDLSPRIQERIEKFNIAKDKHLASVGDIPSQPQADADGQNGEEESSEGGTPEPVSLQELNMTHIQYQRDNTRPGSDPYHVKSKWDFRNDNGTFEDGWEKIFLGGGVNTGSRWRGSSKKLAEENDLITINHEDGSWEWTDVGKQDIEPALAAMHKFYSTRKQYANSPETDEGIIRTSMFADVVQHWKDGKLPTLFSDGEMTTQQTEWEDYRNQINTAADNNQVVPEEEQLVNTPVTPEMTVRDDFDWDKFQEELPHELNAGHGELLIPKDENGDEYNPITGDSMDSEAIGNVFNRLKEIYEDMHTHDPDRPDRPALLDGYFPTTRTGNNRTNIKYNKKEFTPQQIKEYNILNTNKDITEQWLTKFASVLQRDGKNMQWGPGANTFPIWPGGWPSAPNQWVWHKALEMMGENYRPATEDDSEHSIKTIQIDGKDVRVVSTRDEDGNFNYHSIPTQHVGLGAHFNGGRYTNRKGHTDSWMGLHYLPSSSKVAWDLLRAEPQSGQWGIGPRLNAAQFRKAFNEWSDEGNKSGETANAKKERREQIGKFLDWIHGDKDGTPRYEHYAAQETPEAAGDPELSDEEILNQPTGTATEAPPDEVVIPGAEDEVAEEAVHPNGNPRFDVDGNPLDEDGNIIEEEVEEEEEEVSDDGSVDDDPADDGPGDGVGDEDVDADDDDEQRQREEAERMRVKGAGTRAEREARFPPRPPAPPIVTSDDAARKEELVNKIFRHEDKIGFGEQEHRDDFKKTLEGFDLSQLEEKWASVEKERASDRRSAAKTRGKEADKAPEPEGLGGRRRKELIDQYVNSYREMHKQPMNPNWVKVLEDMSDSNLQSKHQKQLEEFDKYSQGESKKYRAYTGNNIDSSIPSLAPAAQQKHLTKDDILAQARRLVHHQFAYGDVMEKVSKDILTARMAEVRQLAAAANMPLERLMQQDEKEAEESGDYGSTDWLSRVGDAHVQTQTRRNGHKQTVNEQGSELRANKNYKPHIVATYGDDGNFMGFHDLRANAPIDEFNLGFDEDNHYHFHGLDSEKVNKYLRYKRLTSAETPRKIATMFDAPSPPDDPDLATLEAEVNGTDYKDVRDRIDIHGNLPGAQELFRKKFGQSRKPVGPEGKEEEAPRFFMDDRDRVGATGWYHPESESWINPFRYNELKDNMAGQPGSGRAILQGGDYYGRSRRGKRNTPDPKFSFALPTEAKKAKLRTGYADQSYYMDDTGSIAHSQDSFENGNRQSHEAPQTVNGVVHDWYAQEMGNQVKANPQAFKDEQNNMRDVAVIDAPQRPPVQAPPIQNMFFQLEAVGGEPGSALERRETKQKSGWNWFDKKIAKPKVKAIARGIGTAGKVMQHPASRQARSPLTSQQLGQDYSWSNLREAKQKFFDVIDWPQSQIVSWLGRLALPGITSERAEDKVIRRIRQGYKQQARTEAVLRETAGRLTINGQKLSDVYVAPGEQKARTEDYKELHAHLTHQGNYHRIQAKQALENKDTEAQKHHNAEHNRYQAAGNDLKPLDSKMPNHWERINNMYNDHLGKVQQAPPADEALQQWGGEMSQPDQEDWGVRMRQPEQTQGATQPQKPIATMFDGSQDTGQSQGPQKPIATMFDKSLQKYYRPWYNKVGTL